MAKEVVGVMVIFYLVLAWSRRLLDEKVRSQGVLFCGFWKFSEVDIWEDSSSSLPLPELLGFL